MLLPFVRWAAGCAVVSLLAVAPALSQETQTQETRAGLHISVVDGRAHQPVAGVSVVLTPTGSDQPVANATTDAEGRAEIAAPAAGDYTLQVAKSGFFPAVQKLRFQIGQSLEYAFTLAATEIHSQTVTVTADAGASEAATGTPPAEVTHEMLASLPLPANDVASALPLVPGVVRTTDGRVAINGARESESAVQVNHVDASDPATGNFSVSLPLDVVDEIKVYEAPYLGEFGQFTGGVTTIETRGGTDEWKYDFNDFLPQPRFRNDSIFGFRGASPRIRVAGPLVGHKLYISEGLTYNLDKTPVRGLAFPTNLSTGESKDSFTQLDWIPSDKDVIKITLNVSPNHLRYANLDEFQPQGASPDMRHNDERLAVAVSHAFSSGGTFEQLFDEQQFRTDVWPQGNAPMLLLTSGDAGDFFSAQHRHASRTGWSGDYIPANLHWHGVHQFKFGSGVSLIESSSNFLVDPVKVYRPDSTLTQSITFQGGTGLHVINTEWFGYAQDQWALSPRLSIDISGRYEAESIADALHVAPRFGFSYALPLGLTLRGGAGIFYDGLPLNVADFGDYPQRTVTNYAADGTTVTLVRTYPNLLTDFTASPKQARFLPGGDFNFLPYNDTWNVELEKQIGARYLITGNYLTGHTRRQFVVAPVSDSLGTLALSLSNSGNMRYQKLQFTGRASLPGGQLLNLSYVYSRAKGDLNDFDSIFGDDPAPLIHRNAYAPLPYDVPNRFVAWGTFHLPQAIIFSPIYDVHTGFPYSVLTPDWLYAGSPDSQRFPRYQDVDFTITKGTAVWKKYTVRWGFDIYNTFSHFNPIDVQNHQGDPRFGLFLANQYRYFEPEFDLVW